jgi:Flp pilus assembly protein TadD
MSYTAKRLIILLMAWGLIVFAGVTVRINLAQRPISAGTPTPAAPTAPPDRLSQLQATMQADPNNLPALLELADSLYQAKDWDNAIAAYQRVVAAQPHDPDILMHLAAAQIYAIRIGEARQTLEQVVQLAPTRADAHLLLGLALSRDTPPNTARARQEWQQVLTLAPNSDLARQAQTLLAENR